MREFSNRAIVLSVLIALALCAVLVATFSFSTDVALAADDSGELTESTATASLTKDSTVTYYASFADAVAATGWFDSTIKLLKDSEFCGFSEKKFSLDLNGHKLNAPSRFTVSYSHVIIFDNSGNGGIEGNQISFTSAELTINSGKIGSVYVNDGTKMYVNGGYIGYVGCNTNTFKVRKDAVIGTVCYSSGGNYFEEGCTINSITTSAITGNPPFGGLLCDGCAYQNADTDELIKLSDMASGIPVNIVHCNHSSYTNSACDYCGQKCQHTSYDSDMKCTTCSAEILAKIVDGDTETNFISFADAVAVAPSADSGKTATITLLNDCEFCDFSEKSVIIDLNGKVLKSSSPNRVQISSSNVTIQDSSELNNGEFRIDAPEGSSNAGISFNNCTVNILSGTFTDVLNNSVISMYQSSNANISGGIFKVKFIATFDSKVTINGQENNSVSFLEFSVITASSVQISNAIIDTLMISKIMPILKEEVYVLKFNFQGIDADYKGLLCEGSAYYTADGSNTYVKPSDMSFSIPVRVVNCTHEDFIINEEEQYVCDYCGYVCVHEKFDTTTHACALCSYPCPHESYDEKGACKACSYVCPHDSVDDSNTCTVCGNTMNVKLTNSQGTKYFIDLANAFAACEGEDSLVILNDMELRSNATVNKDVTLDLNGKRLLAYFVKFDSKSVITDSVGGGLILVSADILNTTADIELRGKDDTEFKILKYSFKIKVYGGNITKVLDDYGKLCDLLPEGYMFVENGKALLWSEVLAKSANYTGSLIVQECKHTDLDGNLVCQHCNYTMPAGDAINRVSSELEAAQKALQEAIDQKADAATINDRLDQLNAAIQAAEATRKANDDTLNSTLSKQIEDAQQAAISSANTALETAKTELTQKINAKASTEEVNEAIVTLNKAIESAKTACNDYADEKDTALKLELEDAIKTARSNAITSANNALSDAKAELIEKIDAKASASDVTASIATLNTAIANAEAASKAYADEKDMALKSDLEELIKTAKSEAISAANTALDAAKLELNNAISKKADASEVNKSIESLTAAIANAQSVNTAYVDEKDQALKTELEGKIAQAKDEVTAAITALSQRLESVENKTDTLQTVLIVFIVLLSLANVATVVTFVLRKRI